MKYRHVFSLRLSLMSFYSLERGYKGSMAELSTANLYYDDANMLIMLNGWQYFGMLTLYTSVNMSIDIVSCSWESRN